MHHHINHCWCSASNHDDGTFDSRNMVDINKLEYDADDWDSLIEMTRVPSQERMDTIKRLSEQYPEMYDTEEKIAAHSLVECPMLKPEVIEWLNENIKPAKDGSPGWAIGNDEYRTVQSYNLTIWFIRHPDAQKFIKEWSSFGKATSYFDYFKNPIVNLVLDTTTMKYRNRHEDDKCQTK